MKLNSLVEETLIQALYEASQAGVKIDLIVRGICCLRPRRARRERETSASPASWGVSSSTVASTTSATAASPRIYLGSADWMPRNLYRRVEVVFPVRDPQPAQTQ